MSSRLLENTWRDFIHALRTMRKNPAFAVTATITLALGIGGNTAMFTVIRAVLLKPLEYRDPDRLVRFSIDNGRQNQTDIGFARLRFEEIQRTAQSFERLGAHFIAVEDVTLSGGSAVPEALKAARVSGNFLEVLGVQPALGRGFLPDEDRPGGPAVAMISAALWKRRFGGDAHAIGAAATINSTTHTVVGVLPEGFQFPIAGVDIWLPRPAEFSALPPQAWPRVPILIGIGRLKPGITLEQARAELSVLNRQYIGAHRGLYDADPTVTMRVVWLKDRLVANVRTMLWMLFGAVGFVLLIACANVASLALARSATRSREFAVRAALGAGRGRLMRQLLAESLTLALAGGLLGVFLAKWTLSAIARLGILPRSGEIRLDGTVLGFTIALSIATGILFGLFPSLEASRPDLADVLKERVQSAGRAARRGMLGVSARGLLVVGQVALSIVLLIGAALLIESLARLHGVEPGFQAANLLTMKIALPPSRYDTRNKKLAFFEELVRRVEATSGVRGAAAALTVPSGPKWATPIQIVEQPAVIVAERPQAQMQSVTPGYFHTLGIPLRRGREFTARDDAPGAPPVVIVNESFARRLWPSYPRGLDPAGQHLRTGQDSTSPGFEIVGIAANVLESGLAGDAAPEIYLPWAIQPPQTASLIVRTTGDPLRFVSAIRGQVVSIDRDQAISDVRTMDDVVESSVSQQRLTLVLLGSFAGVALLLAVVGMYGVIAYSVAQRTQELGIRRALGAQWSDVMRLVLGQSLALALAGVAIGAGGALALTRVMSGLLFHVSATDPVTYVGIAVLFVIVALAASFIPAWRAARIDPMIALR